MYIKKKSEFQCQLELFHVLWDRRIREEVIYYRLMNSDLDPLGARLQVLKRHAFDKACLDLESLRGTVDSRGIFGLHGSVRNRLSKLRALLFREPGIVLV